MTGIEARRSRAVFGPLDRLSDAVAAVPVWVWLALLVAVSAAIRFVLSRSSPAPWIFVDELIYSELSKSFAAGEGLAIRDVVTGSYGFVYPVLISPAWALFDNLPHAYAAAKALNAVLMSLAAVPAYLIARRFAGKASSFVVAVLTVAVPSLVYTGTIMTENAFYPAFLLAVYMIVLGLERGTTSRQLWALALIAVAFLIRVQAVALVAAMVSAIVIAALLERGGWRAVSRRLAAYRVTWIALGGGAALLVAVQLARGRPITEVIGAYRAAESSDYSVGEVAKWFLWHVAELDLYVAVVPFAALLLLALLACRRSADASERLLAAVAVPTIFWLALLVGAFASQPSVQRIQERNLFHVAPLLFVALMVWIERGAPRPRWPALFAAVVAAGLPATIPYFRLINVSAVSDTLMLLPLWNLQDSVISGDQVRLVVSLCAVAAGALFLFLPRRFMLVAPALVLVYFAVVAGPISGRIEDASVGALYSGIRTQREWIDDALPDGATAVAIWTGQSSRYTIWENEFFNRAVGPVYRTGEPLPGNLPETSVTIDDETGALLVDGRSLEAEFALSDGSFPLEGEVVAQDPGTGMTVYRTDGPLRLAARVEGIYPNDNWSGPEVTYTLLRCDGGTLTVMLTSDPNLFAVPQTVTASIGGRDVSSVMVRPTDSDVLLRVPLSSEDGRCVVRFAVSPTAVPAEVTGSDDTRELGVHFTSFRYQP